MKLKRTKRIACVAVVILALGVSSGALAAVSVVGTYTTTVSQPPQLKGTWRLTLMKGGIYRVALNGKALASGTYSTTATTITLHEPAGCGGTGTYAWKKSGKSMTFIRKRESQACPERAAVLAHPFTQVR